MRSLFRLIRHTALAARLLRAVVLVCFVLSLFVAAPAAPAQAHSPYAAQPASASLLQVSAPPQINKMFSPIGILPGDTSRLTVTIYNPNSFELSSAAWTDNLQGVQPGIRIADPANLTNTCRGTVSAPVGGSVLSLTGGIIPAQIGSTPGSCSVAVDVTSTAQGSLINTIPEGGLTATGGGFNLTSEDSASATLNVTAVQPPSLNLNFNPNTIWVGQVAVLTINIVNTDLTNPLTQVSLASQLPPGIILADPVSPSLTGCGGAAVLAASAHTDTLSLTGASISPNSTCRVRVNVTSFTPDTYTHTIPIGAVQTHQGVTNNSPASNPLNVQGIALTKTFAPDTIEAGEQSTVTIGFENRTSEPYTGVTLQDTMPGSVLEIVPGSASTTCNPASGDPASIIIDSAVPPRWVRIEGGEVPAASGSTPGACTLSFKVTAPASAASGSHTNTIPIGALETDQDVTNVAPGSDTLDVTAITVDLNKSFNPPTFEAGGQSLLTITLTNSTSVDLTGVGLTDYMPENLFIVPDTEDTTCGGMVSATNTPPSLTLTGGSLPSDSACTLTVKVTTLPGSSGTSYFNMIPASELDSTEGVTNVDETSGTVRTYTAGTGLAAVKSFSPNVIRPGENSRVRLTFTAPADQDITGFSVTDRLPDGVTISNSTAPSTSGCGSPTLTAPTGGDTVSLTGASFPKGTTCTVNVYVTASVPNLYTNLLEPERIGCSQSQTIPETISANLRVTTLSVSKAFYPTTVHPNGVSTLTITLQNTHTAPLINASVVDNLTSWGSAGAGSGLFVADDPSFTSTCGGTVTAVPNSQTIRLTGGVIPAQVGGVPGICTVSVNVKGTGSARTGTNTINNSSVSGVIESLSRTVTAYQNATAQLSVASLSLSVVKGFDPLTVFGGSSSTMSIQIINPNNALLTGIKLTDTMPAHMMIANPPEFSTGTCGGTLTGTPGDNVLYFSGGVLPANRRCTLTASVTMDVNGNLTNVIPTGGVTTLNGVSNAQPTEATLTNLPGASISKFFTPPTILAEPDQFSILNITIENTGNVSLTGLGFIDNLPGALPNGLFIAGGAAYPSAPAPTSTCGGVLTALPGEQSIRLEGGSLGVSAETRTCLITVPVTSTEPGSYRNVIPENTLTSTEDATNITPAEDTLTVTAAAQLQIVKTVTSVAPFDLDETITYNIHLSNNGDVTLTNVTLTEAGAGAVIESCTPAMPGALAPGQSMDCTATHVVTQDDVDAATYTNTAVASSDQVGPVSDSLTVPIAQVPGLSLSKTVTSSGPYTLGSVLNYSLVLTNIGGADLTNVTLSDPGVTLTGCDRATPATLPVGESLTCTATHTVTQANIDAGSFTNIASGDSDETEPVSDTVTVPISQSPALSVFKQITSNPPFRLGDTITYEISALNTGNQTLTGVTVTDPGTGVVPGACTPAAPATLPVGQMMSCVATHVVTQSDIDAASFTNVAYADSDQTGPASGSTRASFTQIPGIQLSKTGTLNLNVVPPNDVANPGDTIAYTFAVTNSGNVTLTNIVLEDLVSGVTTSGGPIASLAPGATDSATFTGAYTLTQADIDSGEFTNTASATGTPPNGLPDITATDDDTRTLTAASSIQLEKSGTLNVGDNGRVDAGDTVSYAFTVTNTGNVTLTNVRLSDTVGGVTISGGPIASLAPGASDSATFTGSYTLTQIDVDHGSFTNTATAAGTQPSGSDVTDTDDDLQILTAAPSVELEKAGILNAGANGVPDAGETITYAFTVTNTGNVTLTGLQVEDTIGGVTVSGGPLASLAPGASDTTTFTGSYTLTQPDINAGAFTNTATVTGTPPSGADVTDTDDDTQALVHAPSIELIKTGALQLDTVPPDTRPDTGDTITYTFTVTNTGNVPLSAITVSDTIGGVALTGGPLDVLDPGASDSTTFTGSYTLTLAEMDAGGFTNTATAAGTSLDGTPVSDTDDDIQVLARENTIQLEKIGTLEMDVVAPADRADAGDRITYAFTVTNTGNNTLTNITLADDTSGVTITGGPITLIPGASDSTTFTGSYTLTQVDVDAGTYTNSATVTGQTPEEATVTDTDDDTQPLAPDPFIGVAKRVAGAPKKVAPGTWDVTFEILVRNYSNVTLTAIQVEDDLTAAFPSDVSEFTLQSVESDDFTVNPAYNGLTGSDGDILLLTGADTLEVGQQGVITLVVRVIPYASGPFLNTAIASGTPPFGNPVTDESQTGVNPDPDDDGNPTNNNEPTPVDFGPNLFDPPFGQKLVNSSGLPILLWTMDWINDTNIVAINAAVSDPIPSGSNFYDNGVSSGYPLPPGDLPARSTNTGVSCTDSSEITSTTYCYYEGPTSAYPRGRVVWQGVLGPDFGVTNPDDAVNDLRIVFRVSVEASVGEIENTAALDADLNGDGDTLDAIELAVTTASRSWNRPEELPVTGFAAGVVTILPEQPAGLAYTTYAGLFLEIPSLGVKVPIVGVPQTETGWDVTWLGSSAGYLNGTAFPTWDGNSAITAHVYDANGLPGPFAGLKDLQWGDEILIHAYGSIYRYEVRYSRRVSPDNMSVLGHKDNPWLTLLTCEGYNEATGEYRSRLAVQAVLLSVEPE